MNNEEISYKIMKPSEWENVRDGVMDLEKRVFQEEIADFGSYQWDALRFVKTLVGIFCNVGVYLKIPGIVWGIPGFAKPFYIEITVIHRFLNCIP